MSLSVDGFWKSGFWSQTFWADGFWFEGEYVPPTADVTIGTIGGKRNKRAKLPFYETKDYKSRIDLDESKPVSKVVLDANNLAISVDSGDIDLVADNVGGLDARKTVENNRLVSDLLKELKTTIDEIPVTEKTVSLKKVEQEGLNEEAAVIMLLLTIRK